MRKLFDYLLIKILKLYQRTISPDHGWLKNKYPYGYCRFYPSCSDYAIESIKKYGVFKSFFKIIWRLIRCNPFNKGGYDSVK